MRPDPDCEHFSIRHLGEIICQKCHAIWRLDMTGPHWVYKGERDVISG